MLFSVLFSVLLSVLVGASSSPELGRARGSPIWVGIRSGIAFLLLLVALNLVLLPFYLVALFIAGLGAALFYGANGWLAGREYYEQVALRRLDPADVKARRKANGGVLWLTGIVLVFLGTIPILNLIVPVLGMAAMVHIAQTLKPPLNLPAGPR